MLNNSTHLQSGGSNIVMRMTLLTFILAALVTAAPAVDLFAGAWKGVVAESKNNWGQTPAPRMTRTYTPSANGGYNVTSEGIDGVTATRQGASNADLSITSSTSQVVKLLGATHVKSHRVNESMLVSTYSKGGKQVGTSTSKVSADGHTLTITVEGIGSDGKQLKGISVYEKR